LTRFQHGVALRPTAAASCWTGLARFALQLGEQGAVGVVENVHLDRAD
jgi:hypothetical protein